MDAFSYLSVLISIIVGLAVTHVLQSFRVALTRTNKRRAYAPPLIWGAVIILICAQWWWSMFGLQDQKEWTFAHFAMLLAQAIALYMAAVLALPDADSAADPEMEYYRQAPLFFGAMIVLALVSLSKDFLFTGHLPATPNFAFHMILISAAVVAALTKAKSYHEILAPLMAASFVGYIVVLFARLHPAS